eukprot:scaffold83997_cov69-Phaeocystis_antarctica.AAC.3
MPQRPHGSADAFVHSALSGCALLTNVGACARGRLLGRSRRALAAPRRADGGAGPMGLARRWLWR